MSSILTNMSAMTAVANLNATQKSLAETQSQISSGLKVSSAKDNAAYFSIATNMRTNIKNLSAVSDSLNLGSSVVSTATSAVSNINSVLQSISKALISASQPGTDLPSVNTNIKALVAQLGNTVASASFNNVNLIDGSNSTTPAVKFVAGVTGLGANTKVNTLTVDTTSTNFAGAQYVGGSNTLVDAALTADAANTTTQSANDTALANFKASVAAVGTATSGTAYDNLYGVGGTASAITGGYAGAFLGTTGASYTAGVGGTFGTFTSGSTAGDGTLSTLYGVGSTDTTTAANAAGGTAAAAATADAAAKADPTASKSYGILSSISQITLTNNTSAATIATYIKQVGAALTAANNAAETLGAASANIDLQSTYTSSLSDSLTTGVGSLVDADMNAASTRLNALQTQQQLGVQSLSVANQNSQLILKLFQ